MSNVVSGLLGGGSGLDFKAKEANILNPATVGQADQQYANVAKGLDQQQAFLQSLNGQNGVLNQSNVYNQLQGVADGTGPNPAQAQLANATQANIANQAAMMAGQRGASSNPALLARQAAMQGANTQQQAVGQGAALQANQSLNALGQLGQMSGQQVAQQQAAQQAYNQNALASQGNILGAINNQNNANVGMTSNQNNANAQIASQAAQGQNNLIGGITGALGAALPMLGSAAMGGLGKMFTSAPTTSAAVGGSYGPGKAPMANAFAEGGEVSKGPRSRVGQYFANGGVVKALVSPGEKYLDPKDVSKVKQGADPLKVGEHIPGKPVVGGAKNSYANDTVKKDLEAGGIVIPRSITQGKDASKKAAEFVAAVLKKQALKKG